MMLMNLSDIAILIINGVDQRKLAKVRPLTYCKISI